MSESLCKNWESDGDSHEASDVGYYADAMAHLDDARIDQATLTSMLLRASQMGIQHIVTAGISPSRDRQVWQHRHIPDFSPQLHRAYGLHPAFIEDDGKKQLIDFQNLLEQTWHITTRNPDFLCKPISLGEVGLDTRVAAMVSLERQAEILYEVLSLAEQFRLPVLLHCVRAWGKLVEVLQKWRNTGAQTKAMIHGFSGSADVAMQLQKLHVWISIGSITLRPTSKKAQQALPHIKITQMLVDSDTPDHPWEQKNTSLSEPSDVKRLISILAQQLDLPKIDVAQQIYQNTQQFFGWTAR